MIVTHVPTQTVASNSIVFSESTADIVKKTRMNAPVSTTAAK